MRKIFFLAVTVLASCSTGNKPVDRLASDKELQKTSQDNLKRDVATANVENYGGQAGGFTYKYNGTFTEFSQLIFQTRPPSTTPDLTFLLKISHERSELLRSNLYDTGVDGANGIDCLQMMTEPIRTGNGQCYFYKQKVFSESPHVGDSHQRFGRNIDAETVKRSAARYDLMDPNPREISRRLFRRRDGKTLEADSLNVLAAAWLQAENHDWFSHGKNVPPAIASPMHIPEVAGDEEFPQGLDVPLTKPDQTGIDSHGYGRTFRNNVTHWWDASQIYGSDDATIRKVRTDPDTQKLLPGGKIAVNEKERRLYYDREGLPITGFSDNWWIGLELIHSLFAMEHNFVAGQLKTLYPGMDDETIFQKSRLIIAALIAKIHTVEWTPAMLDNKVLHVAMYSNWYGLQSMAHLNSPLLAGLLGDVSEELKHAIAGLVGPNTLDLDGVPFSLTEEFVAVYRMHPLVPEQVTPRNANDWTQATNPVNIGDATFRKVPALISQKSKQSNSSLQWMYGLGTGHAGSLVLHNYPTFLQNIRAERNTGVSSMDANTSVLDMGAVDILRDRERQVPRYNDFRRALRLKPITSFEDLTDDPDDVAQLKNLYAGDVEKLDLLVGTLAEKDRYPGFAFGNTPFYIFTLMASRRLMADPFFSDYFTPQVYTQFGIDWVQKQTMIDVIKRHYPELDAAGRFDGVINAFKPWQPVYDQVKRKYTTSQ